MASADDFSKEMDQLRKEFTTLRNELGSLMTSVKDQAGKQGEKFADLAQDTGKAVRNQTKAAGESIKERPLTSALVAFSSGFVIGMLLSNKR
ncbi:DUF883 domain-containing protein [Nitrosomonas sp.]|uniref:DUF883 domain-containing protein n=1 Tax=Nitrosomonas sp. TaxID=42353 RepID=UPI0025D82C81|nr:DUF883 domain-containing protein [Nitrosomonas sp.]MBY0482974.1 DUF883 domain-containing protein [Nitrosomonas sp.]